MELRIILALFLLVIASPSQAEISFDSASSNETASGGDIHTTISSTHTVSGSDRIIFAVCSGEDSITGAHTLSSSATYNSVAMTEIQDEQATSQGITLYYLLNPDTGSNTLTCNWSNANEDVKIGGVSLTGVSQVAPEASNSANGSGTGHSVSVTTVASNAWVVDGTVNAASTSTISVGASQTQRVNLTGAAFTMGISTEPAPSPASTAMTWTSTVSQIWASVAASVAPATTTSTTRVSNATLKNVSFRQ